MQIPALRRKPPRNPSKRLASHAPPKPARALCDTLGEYLDDSAVDDVYKAYLFGAQAHAGQHRRSGEPYIHHPVAVAEILAELRLDSRSIVAAILHDTIEDTHLSWNDIEVEFGPEVADLVEGVTKLDKMKFRTRVEADAESFRKLMLAMSRDLRVIFIKLADRLHNMRTLESMSKGSRRRIARETLEIYAPIANRLGIGRIKSELEDLYLPYKKKRRTRAAMARERGLEPLAERILAQPQSGDPRREAAAFVDRENGVPDAEAALAGARDIVAELAAERADVRAEATPTAAEPFLPERLRRKPTDPINPRTGRNPAD